MRASAVPPQAVLRLLVALLLGVAAAFCAGQSRAASNALVPVVQPPEIPNPSLVPKSAVTAPATMPFTPEAAPPELAAPPPGSLGVDVVIVLPLSSPSYQRAAQAVRDGFLAAADVAGASGRVKVIGHSEGEVLTAFQTALASRPRVIVGPLVRDDLRVLLSSNLDLPLTIALNQLDDGAPVPARVYTFALAIESDARVLARKARDDGVTSIAIIGGDTPLMKRFASAFVGEWVLAGGRAPQSFPFLPTPDGLASLRREISKSTADAVLIAVDGPDAALARSFAPRLRAYASALVSREQQEPWLRDLEEVRLVDIPWLVTPTAAELAALPRREYGSPALDRLYALGLDAFQVSQAFADRVPARFVLEGATGRVSLGDGHALVREGQLAVLRRGQIVPLDGGR